MSAEVPDICSQEFHFMAWNLMTSNQNSTNFSKRSLSNLCFSTVLFIFSLNMQYFKVAYLYIVVYVNTSMTSLSFRDYQCLTALFGGKVTTLKVNSGTDKHVKSCVK